MANILIVDDQRCVRDFLRAQLTLEGYVVTDMGDSKSVKAYLSSSRPDLVILDLLLDEKESFDLLRHIKQRYRDVPVIILTAYDSFRDDPRLSQADGYVVKSFDFSGLKKTIRKLISRQLIYDPVREPCGVSAI